MDKNGSKPDEPKTFCRERRRMHYPEEWENVLKVVQLLNLFKLVGNKGNV